MNETTHSMGARIRKARGPQKQATIAAACGVEPATVSMWESDKSTPTFENLVSLATALNARIDWLVFGRPPRELDATCDYEILERVIADLMTLLEQRGARLSPGTFSKVAIAYYRFVSAHGGGDWRGTLNALIELAAKAGR